MKDDFQPNDAKQELENDVDDKSIIAKILSFFLFFAFIWGIIAFVTRKKRKTELYEIYDVTDKTFKKWIEYFCQDVITTETWKKKRLLTYNQFNEIKKKFGNPESKKNYSKKELLAIFGITKYEYLKWEIIDSIDESKKPFITKDIYNNLNKFPPKIKNQIEILINKNRM